MIPLQNKYTGNGARLRAAPKPIGMEITIPIAVEVTVITRLSIMPSLMVCPSSSEVRIHESIDKFCSTVKTHINSVPIHIKRTDRQEQVEYETKQKPPS